LYQTTSDRGVEIFHTDRGKEFANQAIDELLTTFDINRSLSHKGCPFDNAVAESTYVVESRICLSIHI
jgi:putative transposase